MTKPHSQPPPKRSPKVAIPSEKELFSALVDSGFEFVDAAIDGFKDSAKLSMVHFAIAIELFLKARLLKEHWSLVVENPDKAEKSTFLKGDAKTVSPDQAISRLERIAGETIPQTTKDAFRKIAIHRNKMVHFYHAEAEKDEGERAKVVIDQCGGWLALRNLLSVWSSLFEDYNLRIAQTSMKMMRHAEFLNVVFEAKQPAISSHEALGLRVSMCPSCGHRSVLVQEPNGMIEEADCAVCWYSGCEIKVTCEEVTCSESTIINSFVGVASKLQCGHGLTQHHLANILDTRGPATKEDYFDRREINCDECGGYHTVVPHQDLYICSNCMEFSDEVEYCEYCGDGQLNGVPEDSYLFGCANCDGSVRDD